MRALMKRRSMDVYFVSGNGWSGVGVPFVARYHSTSFLDFSRKDVRSEEKDAVGSVDCWGDDFCAVLPRTWVHSHLIFWTSSAGRMPNSRVSRMRSVRRGRKFWVERARWLNAA